MWIGWKPKWVLPCCSLMSCDAGSSLAQRLMDGLVHVWTIKRAETWRTRTSNSSDIYPPFSSLFFYYTKTTSTQGLNTRAKQSHCEITCSPWVDLGNYALVSQINEKLEMFSQPWKSNPLGNFNRGSSACPLWITSRRQEKHSNYVNFILFDT